MKILIKSYDLKVWRVIKLDILIPVTKQTNGSQPSTEESQAPLTSSLENYTDEKMKVI